MFVVILIPATTYLALQLPFVQTKTAAKVAGLLSSKTEAEISIGKVYFIFFNKLIITDLTISGSQSDTLLHAGKVSLSVKPSELLHKRIRFSHIELNDGEFNIIHYSDSSSNLDLLSGNSENDTNDTLSPLSLPDIESLSVNLRNFKFSLYNPFAETSQKDGHAIDFNDLSIHSLNMTLNNVKLKDSLIMAEVNQVSFKEKSGFYLNQLKTNFSFSPGFINLSDLTLNDGYSNIEAPKLSFIYNTPNAFSNFTEEVTINSSFENSLISFSTISRFAPTLKSNQLSFYLDGELKGAVSSIKTSGLKITSQSGLSYLDIEASISGLPETSETMVFVDINQSNTTTGDLSSILSSLNSEKPPIDLSHLSPLIKYSFEGRIAGLLTDFVANGTISSSIGNVYMDAILREEPDNNGFTINGEIATKNLNIGIIAANSSMGELTMSSKLKAGLKDESLGGNEFYIDSLHIENFYFNRYNYTNVTANGSYLNNTFDGKVISRDPNLNLLFQGIIGFSEESDSYYDFYADLIYADIAKLKLDNRDSTSVISLKTMANFVQKPSGDMEGTINVRDFIFTNSNGTFPVGDISVQSISQRENFSVYLRSSFANATYKGSDFLTNFADIFMDITLESSLNALFPQDNTYLSNNNSTYSLDVEFLDITSIAQLILPGFRIAEGSTLTSSVDDRRNLSTTLTSSSMGYKSSYSDNLLVHIIADTANTDVNIMSDIIHLAGISLDSSNIHVNISDNLVRLNTEYANKGALKNQLDFMSDILFTPISGSNSVVTDVTIYPSELYLNGQNWKFAGSKIVNQDSTFVFHDLNLYSNNQRLSIDGIISSNPYDTITVKLHELDISPFNILIGNNLDLKGNVTGVAYGSDLTNEPKIFTSLLAEEMHIAGHKLGNLAITTEWDNQNKEFLAILKNTLEEQTPLNLEGRYRPGENYLYLTASLNNMSVSYLEPFLKDIVSRTGGGLTGSLILEGSPDKLALTSNNTMLNDLSFTVDFTQTQYTLNGPVILSKESINLNNIEVKDKYGNTGIVSGGIEHNYFSDLRLNTSILFNKMEVLNTTESDNSDFYGRAFGTGRLHISGPLDKILMDITATTNERTSIHIPLSSATDVGDNNILTFVNPQQSSEGNGENGNGSQSAGSELEVKLRANITPEAAMFIEIDKSVGDIITSYGSGLVTLDINPAKDIFSIQGDYRISSGSYKFVLQGFIERDFTILEGGNIGFNGDVMKTNLNLTANYRTKAAINTLISDTSSVSSRRNVDCQINMTGQLMNPRLSFNIEIPDIDPVTKARVNAALNTEDKVVRQVMSLLVTGSFIPDVQSSIVNNSAILYSNATDVLSNQINKIFNQLEIPLDLSFNYQPGQNGRDMFDAAISAQLFNNRVIVNGNIGSSRYMNNNSGDVVGDLEVEIKLDDKGRFRAKAFSHSADQYSNYLDNSQRNGIGLVYQEEFSTFKELINSIFRRKRKRENTDEESTL